MDPKQKKILEDLKLNEDFKQKLQLNDRLYGMIRAEELLTYEDENRIRNHNSPVKELLDHLLISDNPRAYDLFCHSLLMKGQIDVVHEFLPKETDSDRKRFPHGIIHGDTPLSVATKAGKIDIIQTLIDAGADVNKANILGITPLYIATKMDQEQTIRLLKEAGAKLTARNDFLEELSIKYKSHKMALGEDCWLHKIHIACKTGTAKDIKVLLNGNNAHLKDLEVGIQIENIEADITNRSISNMEIIEVVSKAMQCPTKSTLPKSDSHMNPTADVSNAFQDAYSLTYPGKPKTKLVQVGSTREQTKCPPLDEIDFLCVNEELNIKTPANCCKHGDLLFSFRKMYPVENGDPKSVKVFHEKFYDSIKYLAFQHKLCKLLKERLPNVSYVVTLQDGSEDCRACSTILITWKDGDMTLLEISPVLAPQDWPHDAKKCINDTLKGIQPNKSACAYPCYMVAKPPSSQSEAGLKLKEDKEYIQHWWLLCTSHIEADVICDLDEELKKVYLQCKYVINKILPLPMRDRKERGDWHPYITSFMLKCVLLAIVRSRNHNTDRTTLITTVFQRLNDCIRENKLPLSFLEHQNILKVETWDTAKLKCIVDWLCILLTLSGLMGNNNK